MDLTQIIVLFSSVALMLCMIVDPDALVLKDYYIASTRIRRDLKRDAGNCSLLDIHLGASKLTLCVRSSDGLEDVYESLNFVEGYVDEHVNRSFVDGFLSEDRFYGIIYVENRVYYVEKADSFPEFSSDVLKANESVIYERKLKALDLGSFYDLLFQRSKALPNGNLCTLLLHLDDSFKRKVCRFNLKYCIGLVVASVRRVNSIFRSTDFNGDGTPDNVGFRVKYIVTNETKFVPGYRDHPIDGNHYLETFAFYPKLKEVCLGVAFTAQSFKSNVVGISYAGVSHNFFGGGICSRYYNALAITYYHTNKKVLRMELNDIALAHELGHSFGSFHDSSLFPNYLMSAKASKLFKPTSFQFSKLSKEWISRVLETNNFCFESEKEPYCGNGIVEGAEECDCGSSYNCLLTDKCCTFREEHGCLVNRKDGYKCHPSQGLCCSLSCSIRDVSHLGLSCDDFQTKCSGRNTKTCGIYGTCMGNECTSLECARIRLPECSCIQNIKRSLCYTCCYINGQCVSAVEATKLVLSGNATALDRVPKDPKFSKRNLDVLHTFCSGKKCKQLGFKQFEKGEYCLIHGNLGLCNDNHVCYSQHRIYNKIPNSSKSSKINLSSFYIILLSTLYNNNNINIG